MNTKRLPNHPWVAFYRAGKIVIAIVLYEYKNLFTGRALYGTTEGEVNQDDVLETREAQ